MHDIIHHELQKARVADLHQRARQDRLAREAARQLRRRPLRVLAVLSACRAKLRRLAPQARAANLRPAPTMQTSGRR